MPLFDFSNRSMGSFTLLPFSSFPLFLLFPSFITRTKGKDKGTSSPVDVRAYLAVSVHTRISASRLSDHFAIYEARSVRFFFSQPPVEIYRCLWSNKFPLEGEKTGGGCARFIEHRNSRAEPSRPAVLVKRKTPISRLN